MFVSASTTAVELRRRARTVSAPPVDVLHCIPHSVHLNGMARLARAFGAVLPARWYASRDGPGAGLVRRAARGSAAANPASIPRVFRTL